MHDAKRVGKKIHIRHRHAITAVIMTHFMAAISYFKCMK